MPITSGASTISKKVPQYTLVKRSESAKLGAATPAKKKQIKKRALRATCPVVLSSITANIETNINGICRKQLPSSPEGPTAAPTLSLFVLYKYLVVRSKVSRDQTIVERPLALRNRQKLQ